MTPLATESGGVDSLCLQQALKALLPAQAVVAAALCDAAEYPLIGNEATCIARACERRQREFAAGRHLARTCLAAFGLHNIELLRGEGGDIQWPVGYTGSITHAGPWCLAAVMPTGATRGIGIDLEDARRMTPAIAQRIMTHEEAAQFEQLTGDMAATFCFCAKEAVYKALYPSVKRFVGFREVILFPDQRNAKQLAFTARLGRQYNLRGQFAQLDNWVLATAQLVD